MTTMNREKQKQVLIDTANHIINRDNTSPYSENLRELARIALASLEAEPVAWECGENIILFNPDTVEAYAKRAEISPKPLYAAPPAPPAPDVPAVLERLRSIVADPRALPRRKEWVSGQQYSYVLLENVEAMVDEACRAAMRKAGNSPVTPDGLSTVCAEAYQVVGVMADALGVFGDAAVQKVLDNLSQQKLVHRDVLPFSLPVTPDGWVMVPKELTPEMMRAVQIRSELGGYATSNLSGAYNMFSEFWNVAVSAAPKVDDL